MEILLILVLFTAIAVGPVMIAARMVGARNTGFGRALLAVILAGMLSSAMAEVVPNDLFAAAVSILAGAIAYSLVLGASFIGGLTISIIATGIQIAVVLPLGLLFLGVTDS